MRYSLYLMSPFGDVSRNSLRSIALKDFQKASAIDPQNTILIKSINEVISISPTDDPSEGKILLEILNRVITNEPKDLGLLVLRAKQRKEFLDHQADIEGSYNTPAVSKARLKLKAANWNGLPREIESDLKRAIELYGSSEKGQEERRSLEQAVLLLRFWVSSYESDIKEKTKASIVVYDEAIAKYADISELYRQRCGLFFESKNETQAKLDCAKADELKNNFKSEQEKNAQNLISAMQKGMAYAKGLPAPIGNETIAESNSDQLIREQVVQNVLREDAEAQKKGAERYAILTQANLENQQKLDEIRQKEKEDKAKRKAETINALLGVVNTATQMIAKKPSSQTPEPNTPSRPQTTQSGGTSNANGSQNSGNDCPPNTGLSQSTNTGAAEPGTQKEYGWSEWQTHPSYRGLSMRNRVMFQQKGQSYWYFEMEIKNNYQEEVSVSAFTSDMCKMRNNEINELYSDGSVVTISAGGIGRETYLRSASSSRVKYWVRMYRKSGNGKVAKHDDGSLPLWCQIYPNAQSCPGQP